MPFHPHNWSRDRRNPIFAPGPASFDSTACMLPCVLRRGDEYWMFYAGGNPQGQRQICLATALVSDLTAWDRKGPLFPLGAPGAFDDHWCVVPCVIRVGNLWHLYYTGRSTIGEGLQTFCGIGLAQSEDLIHWTKYADQPVLRGDGFPQWPGNAGVAGGGSVVRLDDDETGRPLYRMHYTLAVGTPSPDRRIDQQKIAVAAHSHDGITWFDKQVILERRDDASYEDCAVTALNVWKTAEGWRAIYSAIGTRWDAYSLCEARSDDGLHWQRGSPEENLALAPSGDGWESRMVEYANVIEEDGKLRLFYCGNAYGTTGIGTALAEPVD